MVSVCMPTLLLVFVCLLAYKIFIFIPVGWVNDQMTRLGEVTVAYIPSSLES